MKSKYWRCLFAVLLAAILIVGVMGLFTAPVVPPMDFVVETQAVSNRPLTPFISHLYTEATADGWYILVNLSDRPNWPHYRTNSIILKSLHYAGDLSTAKHWHWYVGVVTALDATGVDIEWVTGGARVKATQFDEKWALPEHGLNLLVSDGDLAFVATSAVTTTTAITSGTYISSAANISGTLPGIGDLILYLDEIENDATMRFSVNTAYNTE